MNVGDELGPVTLHIDRPGTVRYAGASKDFNPIHYSDHAAHELGLDGVLAHGMWTMGAALRVVTDVVGPDQVESYRVRFTSQVPVPDDGVGTDVVATGKVTSVADGQATIAIEATCNGERVLGQAKAVVRCE